MTEPLLRMESIVKRFAGATALDGVDFALERGEVHALVGENGAGKSTLIKIMTGAYHRDGGEMWLGGRPVSFATPGDAQAAGVVAVHQEIHLLRYRTVAENVCLGREPRRFGPIAFDTIEKIRRGEKVPEKIVITDRFFDKSNAAQFVGEAY